LSDTDYIYPSLTAQALAAKLGDSRPRVLICGHSHVPFTKEIAGVRVVNCGSVGRPIDGDPRGTLALCEFAGEARVRCRMARFPYPVEPLVADLKARGALGGFPQDYRTGTTAKDS
jgi:diadenosine tetraphosphatase ApaH/serine/threonine PP2A family protein phosphatase